MYVKKIIGKTSMNNALYNFIFQTRRLRIKRGRKVRKSEKNNASYFKY